MISPLANGVCRYPVAPKPAAAQLIDMRSAVRTSSLLSARCARNRCTCSRLTSLMVFRRRVEAAPELREALGDAGAARDAQDHLAGEPVFLRDLREYRLAHRLILDQPRVFARDREIHLRKRALHVVENQPEQPRLAEHALEKLETRAPCARRERP